MGNHGSPARSGGRPAGGVWFEDWQIAHTLLASLEVCLDPTNPSLTVASLGKAAAALGRKVELKLLPA